ncbi:MAG: maleylacetoacetate isomerase [Usitatibacteraceae bacterium]
MIVYDYFRSSAAYRLRIALNLKGLRPERRYIHLANNAHRSAEYLAINAQGLVPYMIDDDGFELSQSMAIIEYLDETRPDPPLMPAQVKERAFVRRIAQIISCDIHPVNNKRILDKLGEDFHADDAAKTKWYCGWIRDGFVAIEKLLEQREVQSAFCLGDTPTLADICLIPQVANANRFKCALEAFPTIVDIYQHALKLSAFSDAQPSRQPDYPKAAT